MSQYLNYYEFVDKMQAAGLMTPAIQQVIDSCAEEAAVSAWTADDVLKVAREKMIRPNDKQISDILNFFERKCEPDWEGLEYAFDTIMSQDGRNETTPADLIWFLQDGYDSFNGGPIESFDELDMVGLLDTVYLTNGGRVAVECRGLIVFAPIDAAGNIEWRQWRAGDDE